MGSLYEAPWCRHEQPVRSALTTDEEWCQVVCYTPSVVRTESGYGMWYLGCSDRTREGVMHVGYAESADGFDWEPHPGNPVLHADDLPWGSVWQTPDVHYDPEVGYRMWFVGGNNDTDRQRLGYAESADGVEWDVHSEPLFPSARGPCVRETESGYEMWACSAPDPDDPRRNEGRSDIVQYIYRFESPDGLEWTREDEPAVTTSGRVDSVVYPEVVETDSGYVMLYACHLEGDVFEMHCSTSPDGHEWTPHHEVSALPATRDPDDFDGRYTSTPCVVEEADRYLLYFSTRDWGNLYGAGDGTVEADAQGIYRHVGVAELARSWLD
jgi:hypothetical protein